MCAYFVAVISKYFEKFEFSENRKKFEATHRLRKKSQVSTFFHTILKCAAAFFTAQKCDAPLSQRKTWFVMFHLIAQLCSVA